MSTRRDSVGSPSSHSSIFERVSRGEHSCRPSAAKARASRLGVGGAAGGSHLRRARQAHPGSAPRVGRILPPAHGRGPWRTGVRGSDAQGRCAKGGVRSARRAARPLAACLGQVPRRAARGLDRFGVSHRQAGVDSAIERRYTRRSPSRAVRTERLPSPPARVVGDPEIIARHDSRHTGRLLRGPPRVAFVAAERGPHIGVRAAPRTEARGTDPQELR